MNVLQLAKYYPPIYGGIELVEKMISKSYCENNNSVFIHAFDKDHKEDVGEFGEKINRLKENFNFIGAPVSIKYIFEFKKLIVSQKVEYIYVHLPNPFMHELVRLHKKKLDKLNIKVIGVYHSDIINKGILGKIYNFYFKSTINIYNHILVSSQNLWDSSDILKDLNPQIKVVVPFCIEEFNINSSKEFSSRKKLVSIGRLVPYKGFEFLINSFNNTEFDLDIIGNGPLLSKLKGMCASNVKIHDSLNHKDKNDLLSSADLLVVGSINRAEAYGMTIVEAFYCGVPVIAPRINTGVTFLVQDGKTGFTYDILNKEMILEKTRLAVSGVGEISKIKDNITVFYKSYLSYECFRKGILKI